MKALTAFAILLALGATAQAKVAPLEGLEAAAIAIASRDAAIAIGPAGALLEAEYFRAPQSPVAAERILPCRLQHIVFDKMRLAQSCR